MAKKYFQKALSVGLALTLCAGLAVPAFAATFTELQTAIDETRPITREDGTTAIGYDNGTVTLNENVTYQESDGGQTDIKINSGKDITLNLNGHNITGAGSNVGSSIIWVNGGSLTLEDSGRTDENGEKITGKITGAGNSGVYVEANSSFTMKGGEITGNWVTGPGAERGGGGVCVAGGTFEMTGGKIATNTSQANGGGVFVKGGGTFTMTGGEISGNECSYGDAVSVIGGSTFEMSGSAVVDGKIFVKTGGTITVAEGVTGFTGPDGNPWSGTFTNNGSDKEGFLTAKDAHDATYKAPEEAGETEPEPSTTPDTPAAEPEVEIEIDDPAVPLASGPVTGGEFVDYLWRHEGEPEADVVVDGEYAQAISWAQSIGIISDDGFDPDELVTVAAVRDILTSFAAYSDMAMPELTTLAGDEDEAVLNCDEVLAEFFGEELAE